MTRLLLVFGLGLSVIAHADPPTTTQPKSADVVLPQATATAQKASLLGAACSYTTGMMAQRVQTEGKTYTYKGLMLTQPRASLQGVAVPFAIGSDKKIQVIANEFVEELTVDGHEQNDLELNGKVLEIQGTRFFLLERYKNLSL